MTAPSAARHRVLIVDDDLGTLRLVERILADLPPRGVEVARARRGQDALARFGADINLVITDLVLPDLDGSEIVDEVKKRNPLVPVLVMTGHGSIDRAVDLMSKGAFDFITKPLDERTFAPRVQRALETLDLRLELKSLREQEGRPASTRGMVGESAAMLSLFKRLPAIASSDVAVLVTGESGTGKELVARALHYLSKRADGPFLAVNAGALPDQLLESELFGHVRGAFTDASRDKTGLAVEADGGTLFLDEIGEVTPRVQVKLLRFLQDKEVTPLGSTSSRRVDVRIVAATNRDLAAEVKRGTFREDLYYRLNVVPLVLPPLRERREDIPLLAHHLLKRIAREQDKAISAIAPTAMQVLVAHGWPGNVRELENVIRRAVVLAPSNVIQPEDLAMGPSSMAARMLPFQEAKARVVEEFERSYLTSVLVAAGGNVTRAAEMAEKDRKSFWELLQKHKINPRQFKPRLTADDGGAAG